MAILNMVISILALLISLYVYNEVYSKDEKIEELTDRIAELEKPKADKYKDYRDERGLLGGKK